MSSCAHENAMLIGRCPCEPSCFCRTLGVCRDTAEPLEIEVRRRTTDRMPPLSKPKRIEVDIDDPIAVAEFLEAVAMSIRQRKRIVLIVE